MRLAAQQKLGFYPCPNEVARLVGSKLRASLPASVLAIDPCCGEGAALKALCDTIGVPVENTYGIELDPDRSAVAAGVLGTVIGSTSANTVAVSPNSMSLAWVNPPFDQELGGGKSEERSFIELASGCLRPGGVLVFITTNGRMRGEGDYRIPLTLAEEFDGFFTPFPSEYVKFNEAMFVGVKREQLLRHRNTYDAELRLRKPVALGEGAWADEPADIQWPKVPAGKHPLVFRQVSYSEEELRDALERSPLSKLKFAGVGGELGRPPLSLGRGHRAMLLVSGILDGVVDDDDGGHVVRGVSTKAQMQTHATETVNPETGVVTHKKYLRDIPVTVVRTLNAKGEIKELTSKLEVEDDDADDEQDEE